jgi:hypothetical protein
VEESLIEPEPDGQGVQSLPIELLFPNPGNPRKKFDEEELEKLTESIRQIGILSPLIVMKAGKGYRIVAGERRWRAALAAGLDEVPVIVRELTLEQEFEIMMVENLQREDLDPNRLPVKDIASRIENEVFHASWPLSNVYAHQQNHEVIFNTQLCEKCEKKIMLKRPWAAGEEEEPQPRCLDIDCWNKKQEEAKQQRGEDEEKELLEKYPDAVVLNDGDMERYAYIVSSFLKDRCRSIECENFKVARHRGCNWTRDICLDSEMCESCWNVVEQQKKQAEETAKNTFSQEKKNLVDNFVLLVSHEEAVFMIMRAIELSEWSTNCDITRLVCERVGIDYDAIEDDDEYEKLPARIVDGLKSLSPPKGVGLLYQILFEVLLASVDRNDEAWKLTFGADMPEQESEAS